MATVCAGMSTGPILEAADLSHAYGPVDVLSHVSLAFRPGEVHAIIGENGAGKSTLMKILSGHLRPSRGGLKLDGHPIALAGPVAAERLGIVLVHQEILLAPDLTVQENMFLGHEIRRGLGLDNREMTRRAKAAIAAFGVDIPFDLPVERLSIAQRQLVQIARALLSPHRVVIFDEPTASLTPVETDALMARIRDLRAAGVAVLYISHRLEEVKAIADTISVLRDGHLVATRDAGDLQPIDMAHLMVGRDLKALYPPLGARSASGPALEVLHFDAPDYVEDVSFILRKSEILGFFGLIGAGRTELFEAILGLRKGHGRIHVGGKRVAISTPREAMAAGIAYLTEDRKSKGLLLAEPITINLTLAALDRFTRGLVVDRTLEAEALETAIADFDIRTGSRKARAGELSGGNQQKLLLAKMLLFDPSVVIIDEPTRGVDIGAKQQIYRFVANLAARGKSVVIISSEMGELIGLCHRILVMRGGRIVGEVEGDSIREEDIVVLATGVQSDTSVGMGQ